MNHRTAGYWSAAGWLMAVWMLAGTTPQAAAQASSALELAERIVELQRFREFYTAEWDAQMNWMKSESGDAAGMDAAQPFMDVLREQQIEMPAQEWARVLANSFDSGQLAAIVSLLEQPEFQAWTAKQLEIYPDFASGVMEQSMAAGEVLVEEMMSTMGEEKALDFDPVVNSRLASVFEYVPGSRVDARLEHGIFQEVRIPVLGGALAAAFDDYALQLVPDGGEARVASISAQRAFPTMAGCEAKRTQLERSLVGLFDDSRESDCGFIRHLSAGGDTTMTLQCSERTLLGNHALLSLDITHEPTQEAMFSQSFIVDNSEQSEELDDPHLPPHPD